MPVSREVDANLVLVNARLWTPGDLKPRRGALAIGGGRITRVGSNEKCESGAARGARIMDLQGCLAIPGFVDAHAHLIRTGPRLDWLQLQNARSISEILSMVSHEARIGKRGQWVLGRGWDESMWRERRYPTRHVLDPISGDRPVLLRRVDGHMSAVNTAALRLLKIPKSTRGLEVDSHGQPTGILKEAAAELAGKRTAPSTRQLESAFPRMLKMAHSLGITSVHDVVDAHGIEAYLGLLRKGALSLRICMMPVIELLPRLEKGWHQLKPGGDWLSLGPLKAFSDGSLGARTAALYEPYADDPNQRGLLMYRGETLRRAVMRAHRAGFQLAVHAIGDRAVDVVVDAYESALRGNPREDHRHRIEHFELPTEDAIETCADLGIIPIMQPNFVATWSNPGGMYEARLGIKRAVHNNPHRSILKRGLRIAFGSDGMPYGPIIGLGGAVRAPYPNQRIGLPEALEAYTLGGAYASFEENTKGELAAGRLADVAVIDGVWDGGGRHLSSWKVAATIVGGKVVYKTSKIQNA